MQLKTTVAMPSLDENDSKWISALYEVLHKDTAVHLEEVQSVCISLLCNIFFDVISSLI